MLNLKGRGGLLVSCAYSGFTFNHSNVQTHEISSLNERKVTLGIKEANRNVLVLTLFFFTGLEIYPAQENIASSNRQGYLFLMTGHKFHQLQKTDCYYLASLKLRTSIPKSIPLRG